ncbi:hypothetical protein F4805DRAFT_472258 [Annulohypoxylon moriforme]|nr:hypothetical protein F4805DRAFT_472258 [Annulohypoxylon moriforme]
MDFASRSDANYAYFRELITFLRQPPILDRVEGRQLYEEERDDYINHCALRTFRAGKSSFRNALFLIEGGCNAALWLRTAIEYRNVGAFEAIISKHWVARNSLDALIPAIPAWQNVHGAQDGWTILGAVVEARFLSGVELLLNAGANPSVVSPAEWSSLYNEITEARQVLNTSKFAKIYFNYGFFQWDLPLVNQEALNDSQLIQEHSKLINRIAELRGQTGANRK